MTEKIRLNYRQLRATVQRLRSRNAANRAASRATSRTAHVNTGAFEVFGQNIYQRVRTAQQACSLADRLATRNPGAVHVWSRGQHCYEVQHAPNRNKMIKTATTSDGTDIPEGLVTNTARDLDYGIYEALDLGLLLLLGEGRRQEVRDIVQAAQQLDPEYQYQGIDAETVDRVLAQLGRADRAEFLVQLLEDVNWHSLAREVDEYFFGPQQQRYPGPYQGPGREVLSGFDTDESIVAELVQWIQNSQVPYRQLQQIERNMTRKLAADRYDPELAVKGFMYAVESGAKDYTREFGGVWHEVFPVNIRRLAAQQLRDEFEVLVRAYPQAYEQHVYKKQLPEWQKRYPVGGPGRKATTRGTAAKGIGETMTQISRRRRRRLASRVENARTREIQEDKAATRERRAVRQDTKEERLTRRVASLAGLLRRAERELWLATRSEPRSEPRERVRHTARLIDPPDERDVQDRVARVRQLRERLDREHRAERRQRSVGRQRRARLRRPSRPTRPRPTRQARSRPERSERRPERRPESRRPRTTSRPARVAQPAPAQKPQRREAAPKVIRRKSDGNLYVRVDK